MQGRHPHQEAGRPEVEVTAEPGHYDLVVCLYVHVAGSVEDMVGRVANGVAPGGTLFLVGHRPIDPSTGAATTAASQVQVSWTGKGEVGASGGDSPRRERTASPSQDLRREEVSNGPP